MKVFSAKDAEEFIATGQKEFVYNRQTLLTPGARDAFSEAGVKAVFDGNGQSAAGGVNHGSQAGGAPAAATEYEKILHSEEAKQLWLEVIDIGKRLWQREYTDGNGGNISVRIGDYFLCTPTGVSKGFMTPEMACLVDIDGKQLAGTWKRTSEITTHLAIYKTTPSAKAVVHAHPVHATAYAIAGVEPPGSLIPEIEVFVGKLPLAPYATPGTQEMADIIGPIGAKHQSILMGNHGVICWGTSVEDAYFKMEITDAYCRTLVIGSHIPGAKTSIPCDKLNELLDLKKGLGLPDARFELDKDAVCEVDPWTKIKDHPVACCSPATNGEGQTMSAVDLSGMTNAEIETAIQQVTDEIMKSLQQG